MAFGVFWLLLSELFPNLYVRTFMKPTAEILQIAPEIIRRYSLSFLLLPLLFSASSIWFAMPITELVVAFYAVFMIAKCTKNKSE